MTFEDKYEGRNLREGYVKTIKGIHEALDQIMMKLDDPDTEDWEIEEIMQALKGLECVNAAAAIGGAANLVESFLGNQKRRLREDFVAGKEWVEKYIGSDEFFDELMDYVIENKDNLDTGELYIRAFDLVYDRHGDAFPKACEYWEDDIREIADKAADAVLQNSNDSDVDEPLGISDAGLYIRSNEFADYIGDYLIENEDDFDIDRFYEYAFDVVYDKFDEDELDASTDADIRRVCDHLVSKRK